MAQLYVVFNVRSRRCTAIVGGAQLKERLSLARPSLDAIRMKPGVPVALHETLVDDLYKQQERDLT